MRLSALIVLLLLGAEAYANNMFIPNYYRNRRAANQFSALGWSDRKEVNVLVSKETEETETNGVASSEEKTTTIVPTIFYRTPVGLNVEVLMASAKGEEEDKTPPVTTDTSKTTGGTVGLGYEFSQAPVAIGVSHSTITLKTDYGSAFSTDTEYKIKSNTVGVGYRMPSNVFVGVGYLRGVFEGTSVSTDYTDALFLGAGKVFGDLKSPEMAVEVNVNYMNEDNAKQYGVDLRGLCNHGPFQYYSGIGYDLTTGNPSMNATAWELTLGADLQFASFFVGPQFQWQISKTGALNTSDSKTVDYSLQAGYRVEHFEVLVGYALNKDDDRYSNGVSPTDEDSKEITVGGSYKF